MRRVWLLAALDVCAPAMALAASSGAPGPLGTVDLAAAQRGYAVYAPGLQRLPRHRSGQLRRPARPWAV